MDYRECFRYVDNVLRHISGLPEEKQRRFEQIMGRIQRRAQNPYLHMAIIGDFSTGKSTFINALFGQNLLKTAWQATTAVPTLIYQYDTPSVWVRAETFDGQQYVLNQEAHRTRLGEKLREDIPSDPREAIVFLSATNAFAGQIKRIQIRTPGFSGLKHICVIDTPGVNPGAEEAKIHVKRTQEVLRKYADATIVLFQSEQVYTASFQRFLKEHAGRFMDDAIFIVTMMDLVDESERQEVIDFVKRQLRQSFRLTEPRVFGCCAKAALSHKTDSQSKLWAQSFWELREELIRYIEQNRLRIIDRQITNLLSQILQGLDAEIAASIAIIKRKKQILEKHSLENLKCDLEKAYRNFQGEVQRLSKMVQAGKEYEDMFDRILSKAITSISSCTKIYGDSRDSIEGYVKTCFPDDVEREQAELSSRIDQKFAAILKAQEQYHKQCKALFSSYQMGLQHTGLPQTNLGSVNPGDFHMEEVHMKELMDSGLPLIAGIAAASVILLPCLAFDAIFDSDLADTASEALESAAGGIANFFGQFGALDRQKEAATASIREALEKAKAENRAGFYDLLTENGMRILSGAKQIEHHFSAAYQKIYDEQRSKYLVESAKLQRLEQSNMEVHRKLTGYLDRLRKKGAKA